MSLVSILEAGRQDFREACGSLSAQQASGKPAPGRWSVLECIEHVVIVENRFLGWIANGPAIAPQPSAEKETSISARVRDRTTKAEAPEAVRPQGRFHTLAEALAEFEAVRERSIQTVQERGGQLYSVGATHARFGEMNGAEVICLIDGHARRHAAQIRETCAALAQTPER